MEKHLKNEAPKKMISSTTDNQKEGGGNTSDSSINITLRKRKSEGPSDTTISSKKRNGNPPGLHTMNLNAGQVHNIIQSSHFICNFIFH